MFRQTLAVLAVLVTAAVPGAVHAAPAQSPIFGAYYPGGSAGRYPVSSIPAERLTHLFYAFSTIEDGRCAIGADASKNVAELADLKKRIRICAR